MLTIFVIDLRGKARYQCDHSVHFRCFKFATSCLVLSIVNVDVRHFNDNNDE